MARAPLTTEQQRELAELNEQAQRRDLTAAELERQQELIDVYDRVMVRRAQAAAHLKSRGYDLPKPAHPSPSSTHVASSGSAILPGKKPASMSLG